MNNDMSPQWTQFSLRACLTYHRFGMAPSVIAWASARLSPSLPRSFTKSPGYGHYTLLQQAQQCKSMVYPNPITWNPQNTLPNRNQYTAELVLASHRQHSIIVSAGGMNVVFQHVFANHSGYVQNKCGDLQRRRVLRGLTAAVSRAVVRGPGCYARAG